jgi:hypothetical protein
MYNVIAVDISNKAVMDIMNRQKQSISLLTDIKIAYPVKRLVDNIKELSVKYKKLPVYELIYDNINEWYDTINFLNVRSMTKKRMNISNYISLLTDNYGSIMDCIETKIDDSTYLKMKEALSTRDSFYDKILINNCPIHGIVHMDISKLNECLKDRIGYLLGYYGASDSYLHPIDCYKDLFNELNEILKSQERKEIVEISLSEKKKLNLIYHPSEEFYSISRYPYFTGGSPHQSKIDSLVNTFKHFESLIPRVKIYIDFNYSSPYDSLCVYRFSES